MLSLTPASLGLAPRDGSITILPGFVFCRVSMISGSFFIGRFAAALVAGALPFTLGSLRPLFGAIGVNSKLAVKGGTLPIGLPTTGVRVCAGRWLTFALGCGIRASW